VDFDHQYIEIFGFEIGLVFNSDDYLQKISKSGFEYCFSNNGVGYGITLSVYLFVLPQLHKNIHYCVDKQLMKDI
jgi:hypothetical protein